MLGLLFLKRNNIVINYIDGTVIDKVLEYNLLKLVVTKYSHIKKCLSIWAKLKQTLLHRKKLLKELKFVYAARLEKLQ